MCSRKIFLALLLVKLTTALFAQDTLYFNAEWKECARDQHVYYRLLPMKKIGELVFIQDFYKNGNIQMQGYALAQDAEGYVGDAYWYDEQGYDLSIQQSINRSSVRELTYYHPDGTVWKKINYAADGRIAKIRTYWMNKELSQGEVGSVNQYSGVFSPGKPDRYYEQPADQPALLEEVPGVEVESFDTTEIGQQEPRYMEVIYWKNGQKAMEQQFDADDVSIRRRYWDEEGNLLSDSRGANDALQFSYFTRNGLAHGLRSKETFSQEGESTKKIVENFLANQTLKDRSTYVDGQIEEVVIYEDGKESAIQQFRDGVPYEGTFMLNLGDKTAEFTMLRGEKTGTEVTRDLHTGLPFAEGIYKAGAPFEGTFYETEEPYKLLRYKDGQQDGLQIVYADYEGAMIQEEYEMKAGKRDGFRKIYTDGNLAFESQYQDNEISSGTVVEGNIQLVYQDGMLIEKRIGNTYQAGDISLIVRYKNNEPTEVEYHDFTIEEHPEPVYRGVYQAGKPYEGYFKLDTLVDNIALISLFEKGALKYKYSFELLDQLENYQHYTYNKKASYVDGNPVDGPTYELIGRERLISSYYKDGRLQSFDVNLFAMHYFNRITVTLENNEINLSEMASPLKARIYPKDNAIVAELMHEDKVIKTSPTITVLHEAAANSITQYYLADDEIKTVITAVDTLVEDSTAEIEGAADSFVQRLFYLFPVPQSSDLQGIFARLYANFKQEEFDRVFETRMDETYPVNETNFLSYLRYDAQGKAVEGLRFTQQDDKQVRVEVIIGGKVIETKTVKSAVALLENDRAELQALEQRLYNEWSDNEDE